MFGQTFTPQDLGVIAILIILEGVLSIDNALVLALLAKRLPKSRQAKALTYGLLGAFVFRFIAIGAAAYLLRWRIVKLIGGGYLLWIAALLTPRPPALMVLNEPETSLHPDLLPALARLIARAAERLISHFCNMRAAHHHGHANGTNGVGHSIRFGDHPRHRPDADQPDFFVQDKPRDGSFIHGLRIAIDKHHFVSRGRKRLQ